MITRWTPWALDNPRGRLRRQGSPFYRGLGEDLWYAGLSDDFYWNPPHWDWNEVCRRGRRPGGLERCVKKWLKLRWFLPGKPRALKVVEAGAKVSRTGTSVQAIFGLRSRTPLW